MINFYIFCNFFIIFYVIRGIIGGYILSKVLIFSIYSMKSKTKNKSRIDVYNSNIYIPLLVVANKYATVEEINKILMFSNEDPIDDDILGGYATTSTVVFRKDKRPAILVKQNTYIQYAGKNKKLDEINTISHEATHVAADMYCYMGEKDTVTIQEPYAYLVGWASECIYKTFKGL